MWGLLIALLIGLAYGYMSPGKQDKSQIFKKGLLWGLVIALVVALVGFFFDVNPLGLGDSGFFGLFLSFVILTITFIIGVWIGDMFDRKRHTGPRLSS